MIVQALHTVDWTIVTTCNSKDLTGKLTKFIYTGLNFVGERYEDVKEWKAFNHIVTHLKHTDGVLGLFTLFLSIDNVLQGGSLFELANRVSDLITSMADLVLFIKESKIAELSSIAFWTPYCVKNYTTLYKVFIYDSGGTLYEIFWQGKTIAQVWQNTSVLAVAVNVFKVAMVVLSGPNPTQAFWAAYAMMALFNYAKGLQNAAQGVPLLN